MNRLALQNLPLQTESANTLHFCQKSNAEQGRMICRMCFSSAGTQSAYFSDFMKMAARCAFHGEALIAIELRMALQISGSILEPFGAENMKTMRFR